jgi:hypothetical protein
VVNSTISGNSSLYGVGGLSSSGTPVTIVNSTITGNHGSTSSGSTAAGGIANDNSSGSSAITLHNTIVAGNVAGTGSTVSDMRSSNGMALAAGSSFNLIGDAGSAAGTVHGVNGNIVGNAGTGTLAIATILDPNLADNGGPTQSHALVTDSPAIDAGSTAGALDGTGAALTYDQRGSGFSRVAGSSVDIGAVEVQVPSDTTPPAAPVITTPTNGAVLTNPRPTISGTGEAAASVIVKEGTSTLCVATVSAGGDWTCTPGSDLGDGIYTLSVIQTDTAGNESAPATSSFSIQTPPAPDTTAPAAPRIATPVDGPVFVDQQAQISGTSEAGATITVVLDLDSNPATTDDQVIYEVTVAADGSWALNPSMGTPIAGVFPVDGLEVGQTLLVILTARDAAGNTSSAASFSLSVRQFVYLTMMGA